MVETSNYRKYTSKNVLQRFLIKRFNKALINLVKPLRPISILDVGCGEGFGIINLARNKVGKVFEGIDSSKDAISLGTKMYPKLNIKIANVYNLPYNDSSFDLIVCSEVLEHLNDPEKALSEIKRVSKRYMAISVPNEPFFILANLIRGKYLTRFGNHPEHINHWSYPGFKKFLRKNGLKISATRTPFPWTLVLARK